MKCVCMYIHAYTHEKLSLSLSLFYLYQFVDTRRYPIRWNARVLCVMESSTRYRIQLNQHYRIGDPEPKLANDCESIGITGIN